MSIASSLAPYLLVIGAGVCVAFQQLVNSDLGSTLRSAWWAGFISYLGGTIAMLAMVVWFAEPLQNANRVQWYGWASGVFGAIFIATSIVMVPRLGVATVLALVVVGQMLGAVVFDHFGLLGTPQQPVSLTRLAGVACLILGVVLVKL